MFRDSLVSVIIPVYNVDKYISRCVNSVVNNTYKNLEIICVDDGSTDASGAICDKFALTDSRIKVVHKKNSGVSSARNTGLDIASGTYIAFVDADDWVHEEYFRVLMREMNRRNADLIICNHIRTDGTIDLSSTSENCQVKMLTRESFMSKHDLKSYIWGRVFRKGLIGDLRFDESAKIEDATFNASLVQRNSSITIFLAKSCLYAYYNRSGSLVSSFGTDAYVELSTHLHKCALSETDPVMKSIFATDSIKRILSAIYAYAVVKDRASVRKCKQQAYEIIEMLTPKAKTLYFFLVTFHQAYRVFRLATDPSLKKWEKQIKQKTPP